MQSWELCAPIQVQYQVDSFLCFELKINKVRPPERKAPNVSGHCKGQYINHYDIDKIE